MISHYCKQGLHGLCQSKNCTCKFCLSHEADGQ